MSPEPGIGVPNEAEFLYVLRPVRIGMVSDGPTAAEGVVLHSHFAYLECLTAAGVVTLAGRTLTQDPHTFGIVVFRAASEEGAREVMENDPAVREGVMTAELYPFRVALLRGA